MSLHNVLAINQVLHLRLLERYFCLYRPEFGKDQLHVMNSSEIVISNFTLKIFQSI